MELVLVVLNGHSVGKSLPLTGALVTVGSHDCTLSLQDEGVGRVHFSVAHEAGVWWLEANPSSSGVRVNGVPVERHALAPLDKVQVGTVTLKVVDADAGRGARPDDTAYERDGLTGLLNKRALVVALKRAFVDAAESRTLCLALVDVDHHKKTNDVHGMMAADFVLKRIARVAQHAVRSNDIVGRYGGDEYALGFPDLSLEAARELCERLRAGVEQQRVPGPEGEIECTVSIGVAALTPEMTSMRELVKAADDNLTQAKREGRNRVV